MSLHNGIPHWPRVQLSEVAGYASGMRGPTPAVAAAACIFFARLHAAFGIRPQQVLDYVGRYTHRVAVSNHRLLDIDAGQVCFQWKDYRDKDQQKAMRLSAEEFIRRFLLHAWPDGFQRIRYYGLLGNRYRQQELARCRQLLGMAPPTEAPVPEDYRDQHELLTGSSLRDCPFCHRGRMVMVEMLTPHRSPAIRNTS
jgi:hypothetical protein